jgi:hopanoid biosynthesis associated protein HpnK
VEPPDGASKRLIVNADDFGLTIQVNQAIVKGHREGIITSTSLLANGAAFDSAVVLAKQVADLGVGVHLNLTEGVPLSSPVSLGGLVNADGLLCLTPARLVRRLLSGSVSVAQVELEMRAQMEKVLSAGVHPTHLDGHKHIHLFPSIFRVLIRLAGDYRIHGIRCVRERVASLGQLISYHRASSSTILKQYLVGVTLSFIGMLQRKELRYAGLKSPAYVYGITPTGFLDARHLQEILGDLPDGTSELICHPGTVDSDLHRSPTRLLEQREQELQAILSPEIRKTIARRGIQLISYSALN